MSDAGEDKEDGFPARRDGAEDDRGAQGYDLRRTIGKRARLRPTATTRRPETRTERRRNAAVSTRRTTTTKRHGRGSTVTGYGM